MARHLERIKYVSIGMEYHSEGYKMEGYKRRCHTVSIR